MQSRPRPTPCWPCWTGTCATRVRWWKPPLPTNPKSMKFRTCAVRTLRLLRAPANHIRHRTMTERHSPTCRPDCSKRYPRMASRSSVAISPGRNVRRTNTRCELLWVGCRPECDLVAEPVPCRDGRLAFLCDGQRFETKHCGYEDLAAVLRRCGRWQSAGDSQHGTCATC